MKENAAFKTNDMTNEKAMQLNLDFPLRPALGAEDFFVSKTNQAAIDLLDNWPNWPAHAVYLQGPEASGKTHLAHVWQGASKAALMRADSLSRGHIALISTGQHLIIEDLDQGIMDEHALFHLINLAKEQRFNILFTGSMPPGQIPITLPDLRSRVRAFPVVTINAPDETLLRPMLIKQFQDRQLEVSPQLIEYILPRMERSFSGVQRLVERLDQLALSQGRKITKQFAGDVLRSFQAPADVPQTSADQ